MAPLAVGHTYPPPIRLRSPCLPPYHPADPTRYPSCCIYSTLHPARCTLFPLRLEPGRPFPLLFPSSISTDAGRRTWALAGTLAQPLPPAKKMRASFRLVALLVALFLFAVMTMKIQNENLEIDLRHQSFESAKRRLRNRINGLPRGVVQSTSDMELKRLWESSSQKEISGNHTALLAMAVGISQKQNVDILVRKFLIDNCSIILFHYDGNVDGWRDLEWSDKAIHILAHNQTKWWFAKRFLHPDVVSTYDYIFLWDEDLGVENFHLRRYLQIMASEGLEISQPALDPDQSSDIHHRITVRDRKARVHRRVYDFRGSLNCSDESRGPPCTGWVEGMAPVFSRAAWRCVWHLIQNDLIHGWGLDMKLGYCAQGDRTKKVGVIDTEYIIHQGIPSLGGASVNKAPSKSLDLRTHIRRQSTAELENFNKRWNQAVREDKEWSEHFEGYARKK